MDFKSNYLTKHLITYIGNKRKLLEFINESVEDIKLELGTENPSILDGFSGSGCVSRLLKQHASVLHSNDLENYCETINSCYLANKSELDLKQIQESIDYLNAHKLDSSSIGFIESNYAPKDDDNIQNGERVFYTNRNAKIIDNIRNLIDDFPVSLFPFLTGPLLVKASIHNNTSGVFKGFHKKDGIGHFGGKGENALVRIKGEITLDFPIFSPIECETHVYKKDTNDLVKELPELDIVYYDPPYNQHPYGSNYFMLNIINDHNAPKIQNGVSGIIEDWNRSLYNKKKEALIAIKELLHNTKSKYIIVSYNNEGIIPVEEFRQILETRGEVKMQEKKYITYRGSRNLKDRSKNVKELLWIVKS